MSSLAIASRSLWPQWTNPHIVLYHGTVRNFAERIVREGVEISMGRATTDFGRGFYTTTDSAQAEEWSRRVAEQRAEESALVRILIDRTALSRMESIVFVRSSLRARDFWSFVQSCRAGHDHRPATSDFYDVAYGPVAKAWFGPSHSVALADYDQISFHTQRAQDMLNNKDLCTFQAASGEELDED